MPSSIMSITIVSLLGMFLFTCQTASAKAMVACSPLDRVWLERIGRNSNNHRWHIRGGSSVDMTASNDTNQIVEGGNVTITEDQNSTLVAATFQSPQARIKAFVQRSLPTLPSLSGPKLVIERWQEHLNRIGAHATAAHVQSMAQVQVLLETLQHHSPILSAVVGSLALAVLSQVFLKPPNNGLALPTVYSLALLGSSAGFHLFLYFITVGYALGIAIPLAVALIFYNVRPCRATTSAISLCSL